MREMKFPFVAKHMYASFRVFIGVYIIVFDPLTFKHLKRLDEFHGIHYKR